jgi:hypothetical protein
MLIRMHEIFDQHIFNIINCFFYAYGFKSAFLIYFQILYLFSCPFRAGLVLLLNEFMWAGLASVR